MLTGFGAQVGRDLFGIASHQKHATSVVTKNSDVHKRGDHQ